MTVSSEFVFTVTSTDVIYFDARNKSELNLHIIYNTLQTAPERIDFI